MGIREKSGINLVWSMSGNREETRNRLVVAQVVVVATREVGKRDARLSIAKPTSYL